MIEAMLRELSADGAGPMHTDSSAIATCLRLRSTVECTATVRMHRAWHARRMRSAISPRLAITTLSSMGFGLRELGFGKGIRRADTRGEGRRVGKEWVRKGRERWEREKK